MKKFGFTLTEILVSMTILGVIIAITIPQFTGNVRNQGYASKLSTVVSDYENVFGMMLLRENCDRMEDTALANATTDSDVEDVFDRYTKITEVGHNSKDFKFIRGGGSGSLTPRHDISIPNGAVIYIAPNPSGATNDMWNDLLIDVNGDTAPNTLGRDIFRFALGQDGHLYPYGSAEARTLANLSATWKDNNVDFGCTGSTNYRGFGCTARLVEHNYKVDY